MTCMNQFKMWIAAHPWLTVFFSSLFTMLPTLVAFREDWLLPCLTIGVCGLAMWSISMWKHGKTLMALLLTLAMVTQPLKAEEQVQPAAVPVAVGVVVICVGGYCIYRVVKFCQKKFPKSDGSTNSVAFLAQGGDGDEYGASWNYGSAGSCAPWDGDYFAPASDGPESTTVTMTAWLGYNNDLSSTISYRRGEGTYQDFRSFQAEVESHGLRVTGTADGSQYFSANRVPCDESAIPLRFDPVSKAVIHDVGGALRNIIVERSSNLVDWSHFITTTTSEGSGVQIQDTTTSGQMFYRMRLQ